MKRTLLLMFSLLIVVSCKSGKEESAAVASAFSASAQNYWPQAKFPITLKISTSFDATTRGLIQDMGAEWENNVGVDLFDLSLTTGNPDHAALGSYYGTEMGIYIANNATTDLPSQALAVTQIYGYTRNPGQASEYVELVHADIVVNEFNFDFSNNNTFGTYDLPTVILHEMGHFIGQQHYFGADTSIMYPSISSSTNLRNIGTVDIDKLLEKYGPGKNPANSRLPAGSENDEFIQMVLELRADGNCVHKVNNKIVESHKVEIKKASK